MIDRTIVEIIMMTIPTLAPTFEYLFYIRLCILCLFMICKVGSEDLVHAIFKNVLILNVIYKNAFNFAANLEDTPCNQVPMFPFKRTRKKKKKDYGPGLD